MTRILHIDDRPEFLAQVRSALTPCGFDVTSCQTAAAARIEIGNGLNPDTLIVDHEGFSVAVEMLASQSTIPVLVLSCATDDADFKCAGKISKLLPQWRILLTKAVSRATGARFNDDELAQKPEHRDKIIVIGGRPEKVLHVAATLTEAELFIQSSKECDSRLVLGICSETTDSEEFLSYSSV